MVYLTYSQGYRHAGANAVPTTGKYAENPDFFIFDSDSVDNYEVGYKGSNDRLNWAVSLYYNDWKDPQLNTATSNWGFFAAINGESARDEGLEVELSGLLGDSLSYSLGYTYADAELTADVYAPAGNFYGGSALHRTGSAPTATACRARPSTSFTVSLRHDMTFANDIELATVLSGYYQSEVSNSLGDDVCLTEFNPIGNCRDSANPASAFYAPQSVFSRSFAEVDGFDLWNLSTTASKDSWSARCTSGTCSTKKARPAYSRS